MVAGILGTLDAQSPRSRVFFEAPRKINQPVAIIQISHFGGAYAKLIFDAVKIQVKPKEFHDVCHRFIIFANDRFDILYADRNQKEIEKGKDSEHRMARSQNLFFPEENAQLAGMHAGSNIFKIYQSQRDISFARDQIVVPGFTDALVPLLMLLRGNDLFVKMLFPDKGLVTPLADNFNIGVSDLVQP